METSIFKNLWSISYFKYHINTLKKFQEQTPNNKQMLVCTKIVFKSLESSAVGRSVFQKDRVLGTLIVPGVHEHCKDKFFYPNSSRTQTIVHENHKS